MSETDRLIEVIRANVIGDDEAVVGPFGLRRVTYADYTASGRSLAFIENFIREAVLPLYANTHTESSGTGLADQPLPGGCAPDHPRGSRRHGDRPRGAVRRLGLDRRHRQAHRLPRDPASGGPRRSLRPAGGDPRRDAPGRLHRPLRAPQQRAALARVAGGCRRDSGGPRRTDRPRAPRGGARRPRGSAAEDRLVLGGIERHRGHQRRARDLDPAAPARRAVVLGFRGGGAVRRDRDGAVRANAAGARDRSARLQGRDLHLAAQVHRRSGNPGRPRGTPGALPQPRPVGSRRRHGRLRQSDRAPLSRRHRAARGRRHAGHRRVDPRRARVRR